MTVTSVQQAAQTVNTGIGALASNYETFLNLLTTQLKNQDPLSPLDNNQFTQQLTQMTGVQQQLLTNQLLTQMLSQSEANIGSGAVNLIGKTVTAQTYDQMLTEDGATWNYELAGAAAETKIEILDSQGKVVWQGVAEDNARGEHAFEWNGKALNGSSLPKDQVYTLRLTPKDSDGQVIDNRATITGVATRLESLNGQTILTVAGVKTPLSSITSVEQTAS